MNLQGWSRPRRTARRELIDVALGASPADLYIEGGALVNVLTAEIYEADVAVLGDRIAAVGDVAYTRGPDTAVIDAHGMYVTPGLIEAHHHCYHTHLETSEYVRLTLSRGVTSSAEDFYALALVGGRSAVEFFKRAFDQSPLHLIFLVPIIAWIQNRDIGLTPAPGLSIDDALEMLTWEGCRGLSETPYFPGIVQRNPELLALLDRVMERGQLITGHAADITARELQAYVAVGAISDHESTDASDGLQKARAGLSLWMREGSMGRNLRELAKVITERPIDTRAIAFSTDSASAAKLMEEGTIDEHIRVAISQGIRPVEAIQMATINTAINFNLQQDAGSVAPGRLANLLLVRTLVEFEADTVIAAGLPVLRNGKFVGPQPKVDYPSSFYQTIRLEPMIRGEQLVPRVDSSGPVEVRVIGVSDGIIATSELHLTLNPAEGQLRADPSRDILHIAMVDSYDKGVGPGLGFVRGFGLNEGALAYHISTECCSLAAVGVDPGDMAVALNQVIKQGGGLAIARHGAVVATVEFPVLRLLSDQSAESMTKSLERAFATLRDLGCTLTSPLSQLEFCFAGGNDGAHRLSDEGLLTISGNTVNKVPLVVGAGHLQPEAVS